MLWQVSDMGELQLISGLSFWGMLCLLHDCDRWLADKYLAATNPPVQRLHDFAPNTVRLNSGAVLASLCRVQLMPRP
jgi:hypothetical protein